MRKLKGIKLQFIPYSQIANMSSYRRVKFLIESVAKDKILILQGKLSPVEQADLIEETMKKIRGRKGFKGVEIETLKLEENKNFVLKLRKRIADMLVGDRDVITLIGPATLIKEMKKDIKHLELSLKFK